MCAGETGCAALAEAEALVCARGILHEGGEPLLNVVPFAQANAAAWVADNFLRLVEYRLQPLPSRTAGQRLPLTV